MVVAPKRIAACGRCDGVRLLRAAGRIDRFARQAKRPRMAHAGRERGWRAVRPGSLSAGVATPLRPMDQIRAGYAADRFIGGTIENRLHFVKHGGFVRSRLLQLCFVNDGTIYFQISFELASINCCPK